MHQLDPPPGEDEAALDQRVADAAEADAALAVPVVGQGEIAGQRPVPRRRPKSADAQGRTVRPRTRTLNSPRPRTKGGDRVTHGTQVSGRA